MSDTYTKEEIEAMARDAIASAPLLRIGDDETFEQALLKGIEKGEFDSNIMYAFNRKPPS